MRLLQKLFIVAASVFLAAPVAAELYVAKGNSADCDTNLYIIDPATGAVVETVGDVGYPLTGLDFDPTTGDLYATTASLNQECFEDSGGGQMLLKIDPGTAQATVIGTHDGPVIDLTFADDGTLYGWSENEDELVVMNLTDGTYTGFGSPFGSRGHGLDFAPDGRLYNFGEHFGACRVRELDPTDGQVENDLSELTPCSFITSGAHDPDGTLYVLESTGSQGSLERALSTLDVQTGVITRGPATLDALSAIAFRGDVTTAPYFPVPVDNRYALLALLLMMAAGAWWAHRRIHA